MVLPRRMSELTPQTRPAAPSPVVLQMAAAGGEGQRVRDQIGGPSEVHDQIVGLRKEMHEGLGAINRRLDQIIQMQLDEHAARIKKRGTAVFSKQFLLFACNLAADTIPFVAPRLSNPVTRRHTPFRSPTIDI